VAQHLGCFDRVFASDGAVNLKSLRKAEALAAAYPLGFVYAGNERADLAVWAAAKAAVVVNASPALERETRRRFTIERVFTR
jgi:phosphoserine phosphatase